MPAKKGENEKKANRPTSAKNRRKRGTDELGEKQAELKSRKAVQNLPAIKKASDPGDEKADKVPKKRSGSLRGAARRVKQAIPDIVDRMVEEAKNGNVQHLKIALQCTGVDKLLEQECKPRKQKSLAEILIRRLEKQDEPEESDGTRTESD